MRFIKGQSGNPGGRAKGSTTMSAALRRALQERGPDGRRHIQVVAAKLVSMAEAGDLETIEFIFDRIDGKPAEHSQVSGEQIIRVVYEERPLLAARALTLLDAGEPGAEIDADDDADDHDDD